MSRGIKYFIWYVLGLPLVRLTGLIEGDIPLGDLTDVNFWIIAVICYHIIWALFLYFGILNRRRFIPLSPWISAELSLRGLWAIAGFGLFLTAWALSLVFILISLLPSVWILVAWMLILPRCHLSLVLPRHLCLRKRQAPRVPREDHHHPRRLGG